MDYKVRKARKDDIKYIHQIIESYASKGIILERSVQEINDSLHTFLVACRSGKISGVVSYYNYGKKLIEVRSLAVADKLKNRGIGSKLLVSLIRLISSEYPSSSIFVLTYRADFFQKHGFSEIKMDKFPEKIWKDCMFCKNRDNCGETALILENPV
jgi:amino-acid N-acetyltransferase